MDSKEYGGYLPLEVSHGMEYHAISASSGRRYDCGRTAIFAAATEGRFNKIHIPFFICNSVEVALKEAGVTVSRYSIDEHLQPRGLQLKDDKEAVLLVNYFGLMDETVHNLCTVYPTVLIDNTQAFFCPPVMKDGVSNIYSCRKFIGVPDGSYLVEKNCQAPVLEHSVSWPFYSFLCKAYEEGTNAAYAQNLDNEQRLFTSRCEMSPLTQHILQGVDYAQIRSLRRRNYQHMEKRLSDFNRFPISLGTGVPYLYPYWAPIGKGPQIRQALIERHIYVPTLWRECLSSCAPTSLEYQLSQDVIYLPIDQRYDLSDIDFIADVLLELEDNLR